MAKYGHCENCGTTLEVVGCPNCDELTVIQSQDWGDYDESNPDE